MSGAVIVLIVLALFLVAFLVAWSMVRVGEVRDEAFAEAVEAQADQIVKDLEERVKTQGRADA